MANYSVYAVSAGCSYQWVEKPATHYYTLTFGWLPSGLHVWLRCGTCWMKLWLKVFIQRGTVSSLCNTTTEEHSRRYFHLQMTTSRQSGEGFSKGRGMYRNGWSSSKHMYDVLCLLSHGKKNETKKHTCEHCSA